MSPQAPVSGFRNSKIDISSSVEKSTLERWICIEELIFCVIVWVNVSVLGSTTGVDAW